MVAFIWRRRHFEMRNEVGRQMVVVIATWWCFLTCTVFLGQLKIPPDFPAASGLERIKAE
jgi:hypothetical protein